MAGEAYQLRLRQRAGKNRVERFRLEQARQRPGEPTRAEVYQRFQRLHPRLRMHRRKTALHCREAALAVQRPHRRQPRLGRSVDVVVQADSKQRVADGCVTVQASHRSRDTRRESRQVKSIGELCFQVLARALKQLRTTAAYKRLHRRRRSLVSL